MSVMIYFFRHRLVFGFSPSKARSIVHHERSKVPMLGLVFDFSSWLS